MARSADDLVFLGTHGYVCALSKRRGRKVWATSLPNTGYDVVSLLVEDGVVYAASKGYAFALDALTGDILWRNGLKGLGHDHVVLATAQGSTVQPGLQVRAAKRDAARRRNT